MFDSMGYGQHVSVSGQPTGPQAPALPGASQQQQPLQLIQSDAQPGSHCAAQASPPPPEPPLASEPPLDEVPAEPPFELDPALPPLAFPPELPPLELDPALPPVVPSSGGPASLAVPHAAIPTVVAAPVTTRTLKSFSIFMVDARLHPERGAGAPKSPENARRPGSAEIFQAIAFVKALKLRSRQS